LCIAGGAVLAVRRRPRSLPPGQPLPGVSLLHPVKGLDPGARENFLATLSQSYAGPLEHLFILESEKDPAGELLRELCGHPGAQARILVAGIAPSGSQKLHNLSVGEREAVHPILGSVDSDVRPEVHVLRSLVEELEGARAGAACATVFYTEARSLGSRLLQAFANTDLAGILAFQEQLGRFDTLIGGMHVLRRSALQDAGGYAGLGDHISDDGALGMRLFARGHRVLGCPVAAAMPHPQASLREFLEVGHRWWLMVRVSAPRRYFLGAVMCAPLYGLVLWGAETLRGGAGTLSLLAGPGLCLLHVASSAWVGRVRGPRGMGLGYAWLRPLVDCAAFFFWLGALVRPVIRWRGHRYRVAADGRAIRLAG
jgi:ceramide glucosyltransferase